MKYNLLFSAPITLASSSSNKKDDNLLKAKPLKNQGCPKAKPVNIDTKNQEKDNQTVADSGKQRKK